MNYKFFVISPIKMMSITTCLLAFTILASIKAMNFSEGIPENTRIQRSASFLNCKNKYGLQCHRDCSTIMVSNEYVSITSSKTHYLIQKK